MTQFEMWEGELLVGIQHALNADWLTPIMKFITWFGEGGYFWIAVCALLLCFRKTRRLGLICTCSLALAFICCNLILKPWVDRIRPWVAFEEVVLFLPPPGDASFPSGHTANAIAPAWAMWLSTRPFKFGNRKVWKFDGVEDDVATDVAKVEMKPHWNNPVNLGWRCIGADRKVMHRLSVAAVILGLLIGLSRLYLGMHFVTDVLGGLVVGILAATIVYKIFKTTGEKHGIIDA